MSRATLSLDGMQQTEKEKIITKYGEEPKETMSFTKKIEKSLYIIFSVILEESRIPTLFGMFLMVSSFMQTVSLIYGRSTTSSMKDIFREDINAVLNIFNFSHLLSRPNNTIVYLIGSYILFFIQICYFVLLFAVHKYDSSGKRYCYLFMKLCAFLTPILYWILFIPTCQIFSDIFDCNTPNNMHHHMPDIKCWSYHHIIHVTCFCVGFTFTLINIILIITFGNDCNAFNKLNAFCRFHWSFEMFYSFINLLFGIVSDYIEDTSYRWANYFAILLSSIILVFIYMPKCVYYNHYIRDTFSSCTIILAWASYISVLFEISVLSGFDFRGRSITLLMGIPFSIYVAHLLNINRIDNFTMRTSLADIQYEEDVEYTFNNLINIALAKFANCQTEYENNFLLGFLYVHKQECQHPDCPLNNNEDYYVPLTGESASKTGRQFDDPTRIKHFFHRAYKNKAKSLAGSRNTNAALSNATSSAKLLIAIAYYQLNIIGNFFMAGTYLDEALEADDSYWTHAAIFRAKRLLEKLQDERNKKKQINPGFNEKVECLDVRLVLEYEAYLSRLKKELGNVADLQRKFCGELLLPQPDLNRVYDIGMEIIEACDKVNISWEHLHSLECNDAKAEALYGLYLVNVRGKEEEAKEHIRMANIIKEKPIDLTAANIFRDKDSMFAEGTAVIATGATKENLNKIIKANNGITNLFEYSPADIIGKELHILMPSFIGKHHSTYVTNYLKNSKKNILNKTTEMYGVDKENYVFTLYAHVREYYSLKYGTIFLGLLRRVTRNEALILTDLEGKIIGISEGIYSTMSELNPVILREQDIYLFYICPNFFKQLNGKSLEEYEGTLNLKFSVPQNMQTVALSITSKLMLCTNENNNVIKTTIEDVYKRHFESAFDYKGCDMTEQKCTITTKKYDQGKQVFKAIKLSRYDLKGDDQESLQCRDIENVLDHEFYDKDNSPHSSKAHKEEPIIRKPSIRKNASTFLRIENAKQIDTEDILFKMAGESLSNSKKISNDSFMQPVKANPKLELDPHEIKIELKDENMDETKMYDPNEITNRNLISHREDIKNSPRHEKPEEKPASKSAQLSIEKEVKNIKNSSFANYSPKLIVYAHWGVTIVLSIILSFSIAAYVTHQQVFNEMGSLLEFTRQLRVFKAFCTYEDIKSISLFANEVDGYPILDNNKRSSYNYATIFDLGKTQMTYKEFKFAELINNIYDLRKYTNYIQMNFINIGEGKEKILPNNVDWTFLNEFGQVRVEKINMHSALINMANEALKIYSKSLADISSTKLDIKIFANNWFSDIMDVLGTTVGGVALIAVKQVFDNGMLVSLMLLIVMGAITVGCIIGFIPLLYHLTSETAKMLRIFTKISGNSLRTQIENCGRFVNLLSDDSGSGDKHSANDEILDISGVENEETNSKTAEENIEDENNPLKDDEKTRRKHKKKTYIRYKGNFWSRFIKLFIAFLFIDFFGIYCYLAPPAFFDMVSQHITELDYYIKLVKSDQAAYSGILEILASNNTTQYKGAPLTFLPFKNDITEIMDFISEFHKENINYYSALFNQEFDQIYYRNCCLSYVSRDMPECIKINDFILGNGLFLANKVFLEILNQIYIEFFSVNPINRTLDFIRNLLNSNDFITAEILFKKHILPLFFYISNIARSSVDDSINFQDMIFTILAFYTMNE